MTVRLDDFASLPWGGGAGWVLDCIIVGADACDNYGQLGWVSRAFNPFNSSPSIQWWAGESSPFHGNWGWGSACVGGGGCLVALHQKNQKNITSNKRSQFFPNFFVVQTTPFTIIFNPHRKRQIPAWNLPTNRPLAKPSSPSPWVTGLGVEAVPHLQLEIGQQMVCRRRMGGREKNMTDAKMLPI